VDDRQQKEIEFSKVYADKFGHGTDGHNAKMITAKMAGLLDTIERERDFAIKDVLKLRGVGTGDL
jgi:hypothetical protein